MAVANCIVAEWEKRTREQKKAEERRKQEARDRGEDVSNDDDDDDSNDDGDDEVDEVTAGVDWGVLEDEGTLTNAPPSMQEPPSSRAEGSESARLAEVGAEESTASRGVPTEDRWVARSEEVPRMLMEGGWLRRRAL